MEFSLDNPGFEIDVSDQVDVHQADVSRTSSGSSSPGESTRRSCARCHGRMSISLLIDTCFVLNVEDLNVTKIQDVMSVCHGPRRRWIDILS